MENPTQPGCTAPGCTSTPVWRYAPAFFWESADRALNERGKLRCEDHLDLDELRRLPGTSLGMVLVIDPRPALSPTAAGDLERSDTERMASHLIDVDQLRPSVTPDETMAVLQLGRGGRPPVPGVSRGRHS